MVLTNAHFPTWFNQTFRPTYSFGASCDARLRRYSQIQPGTIFSRSNRFDESARASWSLSSFGKFNPVSNPLGRASNVLLFAFRISCFKALLSSRKTANYVRSSTRNRIPTRTRFDFNVSC